MFPITESPNEPLNESLAAPAPTSISAARLAANRRNALLSTGPRTEEGKKRVRLNACRHDLTGQVAVLPDEEREAVTAFSDQFVAAYAPKTFEERLLVRAIAECYWRIARGGAFETNWFAMDIACLPDHAMAGGNVEIATALHMANTFRKEGPSFQLLTLYEQRAYRALDRNLRKLAEARREHATLCAKAMRDSAHLARIHAKRGLQFDMDAEARANGGFVFSSVEISAAIQRQRFLDEPLPPEADQYASAAVQRSKARAGQPVKR